ncbi:MULTISPECIES: hypothetical protein [Clostridium]|uniref:hypothetical protein n=1 Tax=Clostridium TaxID=1485 RepID=UPI0005FBC6F8|nr:MULTISPECIES: hypothetical protein [Clostridium]KJZ95408.1 hypothetical protein ClosIBUN62F_CONTIG14g00752 [Clostridium sp. IBUN62F]KJZ96951.1 hypothetical protein ClosIBUN22A_CONTIG100g02110 [Clostridium sp. IBUN22A]MBS5983897.1 hypothetical protein [Clostridium butyricum]MCQ2016761.1 hypothetical protein [Clostridium butyricum]MCQ2020651.1 hypothetical protein [Clostridium butyricum]
MIISKIVEISDNREKAKNIAEKVQKRREKGDIKAFKDILQEEINRELSEDKFDDRWTIEEMIQREA